MGGTRAIVVYLLARQHIPVQRSAEAMADLSGIRIATGIGDAIYTTPPGARSASSPPWWPGCEPAGAAR